MSAHPTIQDISWDNEDVLWLGGTPEERQGLFKRHLSQGTHIVREVQPYIYERYMPNGHMTTDKAWAIIAKAEDEFSLLNNHGIATPEISWHVTKNNSKVSVLARVAIIDGVAVETPQNNHTAKNSGLSELGRTALRRIHQYQSSPAQGTRLADIYSLDQYIYGTPRTDSTAPDQLFLVDIEPIF